MKAALVRLAWFVPAALVIASMMKLAGCKTRDEAAYDDLLRSATETVLEVSSNRTGDQISRCLDSRPMSELNVHQLFAGPGYTLVNPVRHILISVIDRDTGSDVIVRKPKNRPLSAKHRAAILRCLDDPSQAAVATSPPSS